jgi:hypothetical protein
MNCWLSHRKRTSTSACANPPAVAALRAGVRTGTRVTDAVVTGNMESRTAPAAFRRGRDLEIRFADLGWNPA